MADKKKIAFVIGKLSSGGAERVISTLSNAFVEKFDVIIITTIKMTPFYPLNNRIKVISCFEEKEIISTSNIFQSIKFNYIIAKRISSIIKIEKVNVIIGFITQTNIFSIIAGKINGVPCIISERTNPTYARVSKLWKILSGIIYPYANYLVVQTSKVKKHYSKQLNENKIVILPNPISSKLTKKRKSIERKNIILNVGRLHWEKNQKMLIEAFINLKIKNWKLLIIGEGEKKEELTNLIKANNIDNILLLGSKNNIEDYYNEAKIFVFTSFYEGFPNALLEAMHFGLAPISTDCPYGPSELINDDDNGFLVGVDDVKGLEQQLKILTSNQNMIEKFGINAQHSVEKYKVEEVALLWEKLIFKL